MIEVITKYFKHLSDVQKEQYTALGRLYPEWNEDVHLPGFRGRLIWAMNDGRAFCRKV